MFGIILGAATITVASIGVALPASAQRSYANCALAHDGRYNIPSDDPAYWDGGDRGHGGFACDF